MKSYFIDRKPTQYMIDLLTVTVERGLVNDEIRIYAMARHGPASYNVVEGLLRRRMLDYVKGNRGLSLMATDKGKEFVAGLDG